ncbi:MAG: DNA mismatch repair endonuclease MutL [Lachnospiraceae bacterium]|nr:DNA mismatch repair endonuclease MutL [Lachnospiraceae bacterium]
MPNITVLDQSTINKIAAGEVVERPASVVKELLENAIDAKATAITVEIKDGGISFIRVTDNGCGIPKEEVALAFLRHATSKIKSVEDLFTISSLGFRGEALASIAAVSQVELITKTSDSLTGTRYQIEGGLEKSMEEVGAPDGTTFIARNLFYNTPARKKFLKTAATEAGHVADLVEKIAMSHPDISIRFIQNNQNKLHTSGNNNLKDMIYTVFGREIASNLLPIDTIAGDVAVTGFIGKPVIARNNRNFENYFINGRYIKSGIIARAIEEAYKPFMMQHKYPFVMLHFTMEPESLDVNVHPTKMELRFRDGELVYGMVRGAVAQALTHKELIPKVELTADDPVSKREAEKERNQKLASSPEPFEKKRMGLYEQTLKQLTSMPEDGFLKEGGSKRDAYGERRLNPLRSELLENGLSEKAGSERGALEEEASDSMTEQQPAAARQPYPASPDLMESLRRELAGRNAAPEHPTPGAVLADGLDKGRVLSQNPIQQPAEGSQMELFDDKFLEKKARERHRLIGQLFDTYWLVEYNQQLYIIDQHAAHEKVLFEKTMASLKTREFGTQMVNPPIILTLSMTEEVLMKKYMDYFNGIGFEIEHFGGREYAVRGIPANLFSVAKKDLLLEMLDGLSEDTQAGNSDLIYEKVASMSCKAAVKGNHAMSAAEADALIDQLLDMENPYACPHGRPTIVSMSKYELEKKFKRIV